MKVITNVLKVILISMLLITMISSVSNASFLGDIFSDAGTFIDDGSGTTIGGTIMDKNTQKDIYLKLYSILFIIGVIVTVIWGSVLGIQFMIASAADKAKVKESLVPYLIGCALIYGAFGIWRLIILVLNKI